ncbi:type IV secretion system protein [Caulobacter sp. NIBR2454]|uniref:type IV secretion system protein n=1 Tax=Caulobacter sp. NIBR2454 TaxID=3015996 RepID=UPI0022B6B382|nr:type IV secretion system protein [Caulobacter sp. NIBR2454]
MNACADAYSGSGLVREVLGGVDCNVRGFSQAGFETLTAPGSLYPTILTSLLTIYVAVLGFRLMFGVGGARLSDAPLIGLKIGAILAVSLSWTTFQTLVFDVGFNAPVQIARLVGGLSSEGLAADPLKGLEYAYEEITLSAAAFGKAAGPNAQALSGGAAQAADGLWRAASLLFLSTVGILCLATVSVGVLSALGPLFIAMFLFDATRGLFTGWVKAMVAATFTPVACWLTITILLVVLEPWLLTLTNQRAEGVLDPDTGRAVNAVVAVFALAQIGMLGVGSVIASGLDIKRLRIGRQDGPRQASVPARPVESLHRAQELARRLPATAAQAATSRVAFNVHRPAEAGTVRMREGAPPPARLGEAPRRTMAPVRPRGPRS